MSKLITFCVPSYNSEAYMHKCIDSLLKGNHDDIEIIIVNDGSKDNTGAIADKYHEQYPDVVKVVHQENGGHGSGVLAGIREGTGLYYKVVDSDDWANEEALLKLLDTIRTHIKEDKSPDCYFVNYVFENVILNETYTAKVTKFFPVGKLFTWKDVKRFGVADYIMMHSVIFKMSVLKECNLIIPRHTFYVDNIYVFRPFRCVKTMYYLDVDFYRYFIGRQDQSVNFDIMVKRYDHQLRVIENMATAYTLKEMRSLEKKQYRFLLHDLIVKNFLTLAFVYGKYTKEKGKEYKQYFKNFKAFDKNLYRKIRFRSTFLVPFLLIRPLRIAAVRFGYKQICKKTKWG